TDECRENPTAALARLVPARHADPATAMRRDAGPFEKRSPGRRRDVCQRGTTGHATLGCRWGLVAAPSLRPNSRCICQSDGRDPAGNPGFVEWRADAANAGVVERSQIWRAQFGRAPLLVPAAD